jgi:hypothetical protein
MTANLIDITDLSDADLNALLGMDDEIDCDDISNSDDRVWAALVLFEDGNESAAYAMVRTLSATDRAIFADGVKDIRKAQAVAREIRGYLAPRPVYKWNPRHITTVDGFDYERAILTAQGY